MINVKRIGHATFETPDLPRLTEYYQQVVGLSVVEREATRVCLATEAGQLVLVLEQGTAPRCIGIAFEIPAALGPEEVAFLLAQHGVKSETAAAYVPGIDRVQTFVDPKGTNIQLFSQWKLQPDAPPTSGIGPLRFGHLAWVAESPQALVDFYVSVLGFRVSDWVGDFAAFLRCGVDHHTVNFVRGTTSRMHHIAFELHDAAHLHTSCDVLSRHRRTLIWGPVRHGPGHNVATYHRDPDDHIVELYIDMDKMLDEELGYFDPRPWHSDRPQKPKVWSRDIPRDKWGLPPGPDWMRQIS